MKLKKGFTLIELLIVIAILAALAVVVVVAINPVQNLARTRDSGRINTIGQLGHALEAYATNNNSVYVDEDGCGATAGWANCLQTSGDLSTVPAVVAAGITDPQGGTYAACGNFAAGLPLNQNGWCYDASANVGTGPVIVYTRLESQSSSSKCASTEAAWAVYSSADGKAGIVCTADSNTEPTPGAQTFE